MLQSIKALLIYPRIPDNTYWGFAYALSFIKKQAAMPPLGLLTVAGALPDHWIPRLVDENLEEVTEVDLQWADLVFISSMIVQSQRVRELVQRCRRIGKTVVAGGPYPTQFFEQLSGVDHFVLGEAESGVLSRFVADWEAGSAVKAYISQVIRSGEKDQKMDREESARMRDFFKEQAVLIERDAHPGLEDSPTPRYDLLAIDSYGSMALQLSRGCPFACEFCSEPALFGNRSRVKSADQIIRELESLYALGYRGSVFFVDDNFIGNISKVMDVLEAIIDYQCRRGYPFAFYTEASLNLAADPELMAKMRDAGFNMVFVGLETTDAATLEGANKGHNTKRDMLADVREIQSYGMEVTAGFIVGMDREPEDIGEQIFNFCQQAGIPTVMAGLLEPLRGSPLFTRLREEKRLLSEPLGGSNTHSFKMNFIPDRDRSAEAVVNSYKKLLERLFHPKGRDYFHRAERMLMHLGENPAAARKIGRTEIGALCRSLLRQPFTKYGGAYLCFVLRALLWRRSNFAEAIRLAITGHHFIKITTEALRADEIKRELEEKIRQSRIFIERLRESKANAGRQVQGFIREQRRTMKKMRKRISSFPSEHQAELREAYRKFWSNLQELRGAC